jgi:phosphatidylglycerol:prolipoprotein diacylglycerol transferase
MYPILLQVPSLGIEIRSSDFFVQLSVIVCLWLGPRWAQRLEGLPPRRTLGTLAILAGCTLAGGRLHYILNNPEVYSGRWLAALKPWSGGFHIGGGFIALALAAPWAARTCGLSVGKFGDGVAPALGVAIAVARIGCVLYGCCFGARCDAPWCMTWPAGSPVHDHHVEVGFIARDAARSLPVHPLQLYFAASGLAVTAVTLWLHPRKRYDGQVALAGLLTFAIFAAGLEFLREDYQPRAYWGPLPQLAWTALAMTLASAVALIVAGRAHGRRAVAGAAGSLARPPLNEPAEERTP